MPATFTTARPLSERQQNFIASLAAERTVPEMMQDAVARAAAGTLPSRAASELIGTLMDRPRAAGATASRNNHNHNEGTFIPVPDDTLRAGRMLLAGGIEATATLENGEHVTLQVRTRRPQGRGWTNCAPGAEGARTNISAFGRRVGWVNVNAEGQWKLTLRSRNEAVRTAVTMLFAYAAGQTTLAVQEASRCGRCMRTLTDPVSIDRGVGPECFGRSTGSRAAQVIGVSPVTMPAEADAEIARREAAHDAAFARVEREQETAAFLSDPDYRAHGTHAAAAALTTPAPDQSLSSLAAVAASPVLSRDQQRARDLIAEALDAYCNDRDRDFAMRTFDQLAAR